MSVQLVSRPPELYLEGCIIGVTLNGPASPSRPTYRYRVLEVRGPYPPDPNWFARPWIGGWSLVVEDLRDGRMGWINEVFVENGRIYAHPWRDEIEIVQVGEAQLSLF